MSLTSFYLRVIQTLSVAGGNDEDIVGVENSKLGHGPSSLAKSTRRSSSATSNVRDEFGVASLIQTKAECQPGGKPWLAMSACDSVAVSLVMPSCFQQPPMWPCVVYN